MYVDEIVSILFYQLCSVFGKKCEEDDDDDDMSFMDDVNYNID